MGFTANNWVGSSGSGSGSSFGSGFSGGGGNFNFGNDTSKYWDSSSDPTPGSNSTSTDWSKIPQGDDPYGFNKTLNQNKKQSPWGDVARFAGDILSSSAQNKSGQGGGSNGFFADGSNGVTQSGDLTIVRNPTPYVKEAPKSGLGGSIGGILGTVAGIALAPVTGGASMALGPMIGRFAGDAFS
jgi:hypothetical protein